MDTPFYQSRHSVFLHPFSSPCLSPCLYLSPFPCVFDVYGRQVKPIYLYASVFRYYAYDYGWICRLFLHLNDSCS